MTRTGRATAGFPETGDVVRMARSGATVTIEAQVDCRGEAVVYRGVTDGGAQVAVMWYRQDLSVGRQRRWVIEALASDASPHPALTWPIDVVECDRVGGFGYLTQLVPGRFVSLAQLLGTAEQPSFRVLASIGRELADAFAALHAAGLHFRDINLGIPLADPGQGDVVIQFDDSIGPDGEEELWWIPSCFMAPEVIRGEAEPSAAGDLHCLAVLLYYLLVHGHPLEGSRAREPGASQHLGADPLFVFDPADTSNAPEAGDPVLAWWPIYPRFLRDLFIRAFSTGLTDASPGGRVTEREWQRAMVRLADCVSACSCGAQVLWDPDEPHPCCWNCQSVPPPPPLLDLPGHTIVLSAGAVLTSGHLSGDLDFRTHRGQVEHHPKLPGEVTLRNVSDSPWTIEPAAEEQQILAPGLRIRARPMTINFGSVRGTIRPQRTG